MLCVHLVDAGRGGASIYGKEFEDEIHAELKHAGKHSALQHLNEDVETLKERFLKNLEWTRTLNEHLENLGPHLIP